MSVRRVLVALAVAVFALLPFAPTQTASAGEDLGSGACEASARAYEKVFKRDAPWYCTS